MMDSRLLLLSVFFSLYFGAHSQWYSSNRQRLNAFKQSFKNSESDIIIFIDVSGSVRPYGFRTEKYFVTSLLDEFSVADYSTRVAIITFGKRIKTELNYINLKSRGSSDDTTKCEFKKIFEHQVKFRNGPSTNMKAAFETGLNLLQQAENDNHKRHNVNTVAMMITDGAWNEGDPTYAIRQLKTGQFNVDVFAVGVGYARQWQLQTIASSSDKVIYANNFAQFKELANYIRGDAHERVYYKVQDGRCSTRCHKDAVCSCGTVSGRYVCTCKAGFSGNGINCEPCPLGSFKDFPSPDKCTGCPKNSNTNKTGSNSISACECKAGYEGNPKKKIECTAVKCPPIAAPKYGRMFGAKCHGSYQAKCFFECNTGYLHYGPRYRECLSNRKWSGEDVRCDVQRCNDIPPLHRGTATCTGSEFQDSCTFHCDRGYERIGSEKKVCQANGQWTGSDVVKCEAKKCPALRKLSFGTVEPVDCVTRAQNFGAGCIFRCSNGYTMQGQGNLVCNEDGTWSRDIPTCTDTQPPMIVCPASRTIGTDKHEPTTTIDFGGVEYGDNSQLFGNAQIKLKQTPEGIQSPHKFPLGRTTISYTVEDQAGNINRCSFSVEVEDNESPRVISCPKDKVIATKHDKVVVSWGPVIFKDNAGEDKLTIIGSKKNNTELTSGTYNIAYTATDGKNPQANCVFTVTVTSIPCKYYPPPINGGIAFKQYWGGPAVVPSCNKGYDFATKPSWLYQCFVDGTWLLFPNTDKMPWPDCTVVYNADARKGMEFQYFTGDCSDPAVQLEAKKAFLRAFDLFLQDQFPDYCDFEQSCKVENVQVICGQKQSIGGGRKRGVQGKTVFIDFDVKMENKKGKSPTELTGALNSVTKKAEAEPKLKQLQADKQTLTYEQLLETPAEIQCRNGSVFGMNESPVKKANEKCQSCAAGTYFDPNRDKAEKCQDCPKDTYQEQSGRFHCNKCPQGTFTDGTKTKNATHCRAECPPGEYSENGLQNCLACPIGYYQHIPRSRNCIKCPGATTTTNEAAKSVNECGVVCARGSFSKTGVEPCELCAVGHYQSYFNKKECSPCPAGKTTRGKGAVSSNECLALNPCALKPCANGGSCQATGNTYECRCLPGYQGVNCESEINECESNPCYQGASCLDKVNGYVCVCPPQQTGRHCDQKVGAFCANNVCINGGACIEEPDRFVCNCQPGFTGVFCESEINECASVPCENGGKCTDQHPGYSCQCLPGYSGVNCQIVEDGCASDPCENEATCQSLGKDFVCTCANGYTGKRCEININDCATLPCRNGAKCVDGVGGYTCECTRNFGGENCDIARSMNYDLRFGEDLGVGSSSLTLRNEITKFTVAFWMKVAEIAGGDPGTPLSYAVEHQGILYDNALTIHDYSGFYVSINNERYTTDVPADDGKWHHIAVSWTSATGEVLFYKDGSRVSQGTIEKNRPIPGGGVMVLGQEQDIVGGNFTGSEAFYGSISQMNVWDSVLSENEIQLLASSCALDRYGNLVAWGDFLNGIDGNLQTVQPSQACQENRCWSNWVNNDNPSSGNGDSETISDICSNSRGYDCQTVGGLSMIDVDLTKSVCTSNGITCVNNDQVAMNKLCPDFKVRSNCPCSVTTSCSSNTCLNGGSCTNHLHGFHCACKDGFVGKRCEKELGCADPRPFAYGNVVVTGFTPGSVATFTCPSGFKRIGSSSLHCGRGQWLGTFPRCVDVDECQSNVCKHQMCKNTLGGYLCSCRKGYKQASDGSCQDINECSNNNGGCQGQCINTQGSFRCICPPGSGTQLTSDGLKCEDINECASNNGRGPCDHFCTNLYGRYHCSCRSGFTARGDTCLATKCPSLSPPHKGQKVPLGDLRDIDDVVTFSCGPNLKLVGSKSRKCLVDGTWSGVQGHCEEILCHSAPTILNGKRSSSNSRAGDVITYTCNQPGYKLVGNSELTCQRDQKWSHPAPRCIRTDCPEPRAPMDGKVVGSQSTIGATIRYECNIGYTFAPNTVSYAQCQDNKQWSNPAPSCHVVNCGDPGNVVDGQRTGNSFTYGSVVTYKCSNGYRISGPERRTCQADGTWSGVSPKCSSRSCGDPGTPSNGLKFGLEYTYGKNVIFKCETNYILVGDEKRQCQTNGIWSGVQPTCEIINCGDPGIPTNGERTGSGTNAGNELNYECKPGFKLIGVPKLVCKQDGTWSNSTPTCDVSSCGGVLHGPSGSLNSPNYPNLYEKNQYCRWKISVPVNKKVLIRFKSLDTEYKNDYVIVSDPKTQTLITVLSGINRNEMVFTSSSNELEIKFISNDDRESIGFEATYEQVSCGGIITSLNDVIQSPSYPNSYPSSVTCVWEVVIPGEQISLEFADFETQNSFDFLQVYNSVNQFNDESFVARFSGDWRPTPVISTKGYMHLVFNTSPRVSKKGFRASVAKYRINIGK